MVWLEAAVYIETVRNRNSPPCILLRESYRKGGRVLKRTLANLTDWPAPVRDGFQGLLRQYKQYDSRVHRSISCNT
jgi:hypothetical protein